MPYRQRSGPAREFQGDPGFFSSIARIGGRVLGGVFGGTPVGMAYKGARTAYGVLKGKPRRMPAGPGGAMPAKRGVLGPGTEGTMVGRVAKEGKRRRINYGNTRALTRASRRIDGFVKVARRALKHTNYKVVSKSAGRAGGSRGVITRAEASRALRN